MTPLLRFVLCLAIAAPLAITQSEPQAGQITVPLHFSPKLGCGLANKHLLLGTSAEYPEPSLKITFLEIPEATGLPSVTKQVWLRSPRVTLGPFPCDNATRSKFWCGISNPPSLAWNTQDQRSFILDAGSGLTEMQLELESGDVCRYHLSPEDSMDVRLEATFAILGPPIDSQPNPGRLHLKYVPTGCDGQIVAEWQSTSRRSTPLVPLEIHLEINKTACVYRRPESDTLSGVLTLTAPPPNPALVPHLHGFGSITLERAVFSLPASPDGSTPPIFVSVRKTQ